jgi:hypothetical protein
VPHPMEELDLKEEVQWVRDGISKKLILLPPLKFGCGARAQTVLLSAKFCQGQMQEVLLRKSLFSPLFAESAEAQFGSFDDASVESVRVFSAISLLCNRT